jgi:NAD(P)H-dependent flavin oxidoreductase YrpB (nitropropane dioxygenase family)
MLITRITQLLGIEYPIIGGVVMNVSEPDFVAAISNAGALGMMASAMYPTQEEFRQAIRRVKELTRKPFGVNLSLFPALRPIDNDLYVEIILEEGVPVAETSGQRPPEEMLARLKAAGVKTLHKCVSVRHALKAEAAGVDAVTVFGSEGGGHIGELGLSTIVLVPLAVDSLSIPVLAAGGIVDGRGLSAALALGAEGVTLGTRLLLTNECPIHPSLKQALLAATEQDTMVILSSLRNPVRVWKTPATLKVAELESAGGDLNEILTIVAGSNARRTYKEGDLDTVVISCSQSIGSIHEVKPVAEVIHAIMQEAATISRSYP